MDDARNLQYGIGFDTADAETSVENLGEKVETLEENIGAVEVGAQQMGASAVSACQMGRGAAERFTGAVGDASGGLDDMASSASEAGNAAQKAAGHWNMTAEGFGFKAIQARAKELGVDIPMPDNEHLFDLSSYVAYIAEKKLSIKQILWFNSLLIGDDYLDGKTEAEYFDKGLFDRIYYSVDLKVRGFADVVKLIQENKLKIEAPYQYNDGLTKEERRQQALKLAETREKMINDIYEHNRKVQAHNERVIEQMEDIEPEYEEEHRFLFFDFDHPLISMFANWFLNRK